MVRAGPDPTGRIGAVVVAAGRLSRAPAGRADRPRGDERDRRPRDADAGAPAGRLLAPHRALRHRRAVQAQGPSRRGHGPRDDPRGDRHDPRRGRGEVLSRPAADPLPLPGQGARRAAAARRRPAHPRVHHEGLLQLRPRPGGPRRVLPEARRRLRPDDGSLRPRVVPGRGRRRDDGRQRRARVHGAVPRGGERRRGGRRLCRQRRGGERRAAAGDARAGPRRARAGLDARDDHDRCRRHRAERAGGRAAQGVPGDRRRRRDEARGRTRRPSGQRDQARDRARDGVPPRPSRRGGGAARSARLHRPGGGADADPARRRRRRTAATSSAPTRPTPTCAA